MGFVENVNKVAQGLSAEFIAGVLAITNNPTIVGGSLTGNIFLTNGLPTTANIGDIAVNTIDGGIYQYLITAPATTPAWLLVAQSAGSSGGGGGTYVPPVIISPELPNVADNGTILFNSSDGYFYGNINGTWTQMMSTPSSTDVVGIAIFPTDPTTNNYEGRVIFNTTENKLKKYASGVWAQVVEPTTAAATVADASLTVAKFASTIRPVELFDVLPTTGNTVGRLVYLTTDSKLYRYTATGFVANVAAADITGTITETQIGANSIAAGMIKANAINANNIVAGEIKATHLATDSVTAGAIQAGAIGASEIATDAIRANHILAGEISATKIAALSIDATKIVAGSISADCLGVNSVTAGKILAGTISANHIAFGTITGDRIYSNTITGANIAGLAINAGHIQTDSITINKLTSSSTVVNGVTFGLGSGAAIAGYSAGGFFSSSASNKAGLLISNGANGMALGVGNVGSTIAAASFVNSTNTSYVSHYTAADLASRNSAGIFSYVGGKSITLATATYSAVLNGGTVGSFTGSHDGVILKTSPMPELGDIMVDESIYAIKNMDDSMCVNVQATVANQKNVVGVFNGKAHSSHIPTSVSMETVDSTSGKSSYSIDITKYSDFNNYYMIVVSAIGEGLINVCGENGNIEAGDLICSSSIKGKGMKQDDDIVRNYTVAKARESVTFDSHEQVKQIACIYMCG